jgi:hypothetical protein
MMANDLTVARVVGSSMRRGRLDTLAEATGRADANFHTFQMLEAGVRQSPEWQRNTEGDPVLVAGACYLAAHALTWRALLQTVQIALRLHRGGPCHAEAGEARVR